MVETVSANKGWLILGNRKLADRFILLAES